jgi:hypothetical protein
MIRLINSIVEKQLYDGLLPLYLDQKSSFCNLEITIVWVKRVN